MFLTFITVILSLNFVTAQNEQEGTTPAFTPEEMYFDIFPLTKDNFTETVLKCKDPWIVIFHDGTMSRAWKRLAVGIRGIVWIGMIDKKENQELLQDMMYNPTMDPEARVYPYGGTISKKSKWKNAKSPNDAKQLAVESLPDNIPRIKGKDIQDFLIESFSASPSKFPLVLLTDDPDPSPLFRALAERFNKYFNFGRFVDPTIEDYRSLGLGIELDTYDMPSILVLVPSEPRMVEELSFNAVEYRSKSMGIMNYPNVLQFLFAVNNKYRYWLPGNDMSNVKEVAEMEDVIEIEKKRFDILFDGKKAKITKKHDKEKQEQNDIKFTTETVTESGRLHQKDEL